MAAKNYAIQPPSYSKEKGYERYKTELLAWKSVTNIPKEKCGVMVALSLPEEDEHGVRERVFDELGVEGLSGEHGLDSLITHLDKHLGKDDLADCLEKFEDFEEFRRDSQQSMVEYISKFDQKYHKIVKLQMTLPSAVLAFMLLKKAAISRDEKMLVLTGIDYSQKDTLYEQAKKSLLKFKGEQGGGGGNGDSGRAIKLEPAYAASNEEALWNGGYSHRGQVRPQRGYGGGWRGNRYRMGRGRSGGGANHVEGGFQGGGDRGGYSTNYGGPPRAANSGRGRKVNPKGNDGRTLLCNACGSFRHLLAACPDSWENNPQDVKYTEEVEEISDDCYVNDVMFTMMQSSRQYGIDNSDDAIFLSELNKGDVKRFSREAWRCAVLDSACSSTVCGESWMEDYLASLSPSEREKVSMMNSTKVFKFGGGERLQSEGVFRIPAKLAGKEVIIQTDVVKSDIPLLLSKESMKRAEVKLDLHSDTAEIFGVKVVLNETSSGHYCVPLDICDEPTVEEIWAVKLEDMNPSERQAALVKLHRQFAHPSEKRLKGLLVDAKVWHDNYQETIDKIYEKCETCRVYKKTPPRPVVALPMAGKFNERVCMDLKKWGDKWILHLIDMWSRFSVSVFIDRKKPSIVIDKIMTCWVGAGFGVMEGIVSDNGGEFSSDEMREVCSIMNVVKITTAAESPFQNGLCERNHAVVDNMLCKLVEQCPRTPIEVLLCWANVAKNSLQMWHGFSSYQLVFGQNPNLPNIMTSEIPAWEGKTTSETLAKHLNGLHAAREAFVQSEADERIRRALRHKVRVSERNYSPGDSVFYKRESHNRWLGPAKVIFQDGKVVFVRHGATFVRVSPNRLAIANDIGLDSDQATDSDGVKTRGDEFVNRSCKESNEANRVRTRQSAVAEEMLGLQDNMGTDQVAGEDTLEDEPIPNTQDNARLGVGIIHLKASDKIRYRNDESDSWIPATIIKRGGKVTGTHPNWFNVREDGGEEKGINLDQVHSWSKVEETEEANIVLIPKKKHQDDVCVAAKRVELEKLKEFGTYEEVPDTGQYRISTTWVLWQKNDEIRARLVARGYEDHQAFDKDSPTVGKSTMRTIMAIIASKGWEIRTTDVKSAFLQGKEIERDVHLSPPKEAEISQGTIWKLRHCLYGLNDAARQFYKSVVECLKSLGCSQSSLDPAVFYMIDDGKLIGIVACHVDDFLHAGTSKFDIKVIEQLTKRFLAGKMEGATFRYVGFDVFQNKEGITVEQDGYMSALETGVVQPARALQKMDILDKKEQTLFRQLIGRLNWAVQGSRPDLAFDLIDLSTKLQQATVGDLMRAIKCIGRLKEEVARVYLPDLGSPEGWRLVVYTDAALANLGNTGSMGAHIIYLVNSEGKACPINWCAKKIKRVVRSTLAAEMLSLQQGIDDALYLKEMALEILNLKDLDIPIDVFVDNKSVVQALHSTKLVEDKRLRLDIASIKQCLEDRDIVSVSWVQGELQLADCMTKKGVPGFKLLHTITEGCLPQ